MEDMEKMEILKFFACNSNGLNGSAGNASAHGFPSAMGGGMGFPASLYDTGAPGVGNLSAGESAASDCNESSLRELAKLLGNDPFQKVMDDLNAYFTPVIIVVGTGGNLLSFLVFTTTHLKRQSSSIYLASLAIVDILFLLALSVVWLSWIKVPIFHRYVCCQLVVYLTYVSTFLSVWYVVSFTIERYIIVRYPLRKDRYCTPSRAKKGVGLLAVTGMVLYCFSMWSSGIMYIDTRPVCTPLPSYYTLQTVATALDSVITLVVPSIIIIVLNVRIVIKIMEFSRQRANTDASLGEIMKTSDSSEPKSEEKVNTGCSRSTCTKGGSTRTYVYVPKNQQNLRSGSVTRAMSTRRYNNITQIRIAHGRTRAQHRTARMLIIVSSVFVILNLPSHVFRLHAFFSSSVDDRYMTALKALRWQKLFNLLYHLHSSINFFLYSVYGRQFRTGLRILYTRALHKAHSIMEHFNALQIGRRRQGGAAAEHPAAERV